MGASVSGAGVALEVLCDPAPSELGPNAERMLESLGGPALIRVTGRRSARSRVVVTLLHGNEPSGAEAVHAWLLDHRQPAVDAVFILASVDVALQPPRFSHRMLPGVRDLNRCFDGPFDDRPGALAQEILQAIAAAQPECVVDVHNNTGHNPPYAIGTAIEASRLGLAAIFARRFIHSDLRIGSLMEAVVDVPCVTIECGRAGDPAAAAIALQGIDRLMQLPDLETLAESVGEIEILESMVRVRALDGVRLTMSDARNPDVDLTISHDIDRHNFQLIEDDTVLGWVDSAARWPVEACNADGRDCSRELFTIDNAGHLRSRGSWIPIMMTTDPVVARQDCLFYVVDRRSAPF